MKIDPTMYAQIVSAVPVVVGGLLAAGAGMATQFLTHWLAIKREDRNAAREERHAQRERLERLVKAIYANQQWLSDRFDALVFSNEDFRTQQPLTEARMIQELYFPELAAEIAKIIDTQFPLLKFMGEQKMARLKDFDDWNKNYSSQPYYDAYKQYRLAASACTAKCRNLIS